MSRFYFNPLQENGPDDWSSMGKWVALPLHRKAVHDLDLQVGAFPTRGDKSREGFIRLFSLLDQVGETLDLRRKREAALRPGIPDAISRSPWYTNLQDPDVRFLIRNTAPLKSAGFSSNWLNSDDYRQILQARLKELMDLSIMQEIRSTPNLPITAHAVPGSSDRRVDYVTRPERPVIPDLHGTPREVSRDHLIKFLGTSVFNRSHAPIYPAELPGDHLSGTMRAPLSRQLPSGIRTPIQLDPETGQVIPIPKEQLKGTNRSLREISQRFEELKAAVTPEHASQPPRTRPTKRVPKVGDVYDPRHRTPAAESAKNPPSLKDLKLNPEEVKAVLQRATKRSVAPSQTDTRHWAAGLAEERLNSKDPTRRISRGREDAERVQEEVRQRRVEWAEDPLPRSPKRTQAMKPASKGSMKMIEFLLDPTNSQSAASSSISLKRATSESMPVKYGKKISSRLREHELSKDIKQLIAEVQEGKKITQQTASNLINALLASRSASRRAGIFLQAAGAKDHNARRQMVKGPAPLRQKQTQLMGAQKKPKKSKFMLEEIEQLNNEMEGKRLEGTGDLLKRLNRRVLYMSHASNRKPVKRR